MKYKLTRYQKMEIYKRWKENGETQAQLGRAFNVTSAYIHQICAQVGRITKYRTPEAIQIWLDRPCGT